jgi:hypothetical protein
MLVVNLVYSNSTGTVIFLRQQRGPLWGTQRSGVTSTGGVRTTGAPQVCAGSSRRNGASHFYMIPLERWNVERKVTSAVKVQREKAPALVDALL